MLSDKADVAVSCVDIVEASGIATARWEPFQLQVLNLGDELFFSCSKSRQIAASFTFALDALCDSCFNKNVPYIFVSINQNEAAEKIRYARAILDAWHAPPGYPTPRLAKPGSVFSLEFTNGCRLISYPCRPVRGPAKGRVYLDEIAHYRDVQARDIYRASLPVTTKGGYIRMGSSPLGAGGVFWEVMDNYGGDYPDFVRQVIPWWRVFALCTDVKTAMKDAPKMDTWERVKKFGTAILQKLHRNTLLEDFRQEYECDWVDESVAWISWDIIKRNQETFGEGKYFTATSVDDALAMLPKIVQAIRKRQIESVLVGGIDIGRVHDLTEIFFLGKTTTEHLPLRIMISLFNTEFSDQLEVIVKYIKALPVTKVLIDQNGIGSQLAEDAGKRTRGKAEGVDFTNAHKELWAVEAKIKAEHAEVPIPADRDLAYQIHSIKKLITAAKNNVFDTERNEKHHADKFWAWALAIWAAKTRGHGIGVVI